MGRTVYLPTPWMVDLYGNLVGKYTVRPMDGMGKNLQIMFFCQHKIGE